MASVLAIDELLVLADDEVSVIDVSDLEIIVVVVADDGFPVYDHESVLGLGSVLGLAFVVGFAFVVSLASVGCSSSEGSEGSEGSDGSGGG